MMLNCVTDDQHLAWTGPASQLIMVHHFRRMDNLLQSQIDKASVNQYLSIIFVLVLGTGGGRQSMNQSYRGDLANCSNLMFNASSSHDQPGSDIMSPAQVDPFYSQGCVRMRPLVMSDFIYLFINWPFSQITSLIVFYSRQCSVLLLSHGLWSRAMCLIQETLLGRIAFYCQIGIMTIVVLKKFSGQKHKMSQN